MENNGDYKYNNVMLLDDSELDNFVNSKTMRFAGFAKNIYINSSAHSGLEFLKNISKQDTNIFPQIIFVDLNMPGMDGFQFINTCYRLGMNKTNNFKIVILTSSVDPQDELKANEISKEIVFLRKPLTADHLAVI